MLDCSGENDSGHVKSHLRQLLEHVENFIFLCILAKNKHTRQKYTRILSTLTSHAHTHMSIRKPSRVRTNHCSERMHLRSGGKNCFIMWGYAHIQAYIHTRAHSHTHTHTRACTHKHIHLAELTVLVIKSWTLMKKCFFQYVLRMCLCVRVCVCVCVCVCMCINELGWKWRHQDFKSGVGVRGAEQGKAPTCFMQWIISIRCSTEQKLGSRMVKGGGGGVQIFSL